MSTGEVATFSIRVPQELKDTCSALAEANNTTLNRWMHQLMAGAAEKQTDSRYEYIKQRIPDFLRDTAIPDLKDERDFVFYACKMLLSMRPCPECGKMIPGGSRFCCHCGAEVEWVHPDTEYAKAYFVTFCEKNVLPEGWSYTLAPPGVANKDQPFVIVKYSGYDANSRMLIGGQIVKVLGDAEIEEGRKIYEANPSVITGRFIPYITEDDGEAL